jgi:hypothetical protein
MDEMGGGRVAVSVFFCGTPENPGVKACNGMGRVDFS